MSRQKGDMPKPQSHGRRQIKRDKMDNQETAYYKSVCDIQDKFIRGKISREEMEQKLEIERLKFIECLRKRNEYIMQQMDREKKFEDFIKSMQQKGE